MIRTIEDIEKADGRVYVIELNHRVGVPIEIAQTEFMSKVFDLSRESNILGHGLDITLLKD